MKEERIDDHTIIIVDDPHRATVADQIRALQANNVVFVNAPGVHVSSNYAPRDDRQIPPLKGRAPFAKFFR